jgi:hypothetical protein
VADLAARLDTLELAVLNLVRVELEEVGHDFRGNQWTEGTAVAGPGQHPSHALTQTATGWSLPAKGTPDGRVTLTIGSDVTKKPTKKQAMLMLSTVADLSRRYGVSANLDIVSLAVMAQLTGISPANGVLACAGGGTISVTEGAASVTGSTANVVGLDHGEIYKVGTTRWTLSHEYGHLVDEAGGRTGLKTAMFDAAMARSDRGGLSRYGQSNPTEAYAEAFADHVFGGTQPSTRAYAKAFGWK